MLPTRPTREKTAAMTRITNLFAQRPPPGHDEAFEPLLERPGLRLERIVSHGHATPPGEWYDQEQDEWVMVLALHCRPAPGGARDAPATGPRPASGT